MEFPFEYKSEASTTFKFTVHFDVIEGSLPFLIGFPALKAMGAKSKFQQNGLGPDALWDVCPDSSGARSAPLVSGVQAHWAVVL